jgi:hypothetical protein
MSWARLPYAYAPYGGVDVSGSTPPNQVLPPPIPGGTTAYYWSAENGIYPYAYGGWAGARPLIPIFPGGVVAVPVQNRGVITLHAWWPYATTLHVIRIHPDGTRHPVRGGYGLPITAATRGNWSTNPSFEVGLNGVTPDAGSPTLTQLADAAAPSGSYVMRCTVAGSGSNGVTIPTSLRGAAPVTLGFATRYSVRPTGVRVTITWTDVSAASLGTTTINLTADQINQSVSQFGRQVVTTIPPATAYTPTIKIIADGMTAASTMDLDAITIEQGALTDGSFFDGDSLGGTWAGTVGLSTSALAPMQIVDDAEAPLDIPVTYVVANPALTGGQVLSDPAILASWGRWCWLTHPTNGGDPLRIDLHQVPVLEREIDQGVFWPIGSRTAVVVSAAQRRSPTAELAINAMSFAERDALIDVMSDGMPLLLRAPAAFGYGEGTWWSFGRVTEDREGRRAYQDAMLLSAAAIEVSPPSPETVFA